MTLKALALEISKREGLKKQVDIAQISEILRVFFDIYFSKNTGMEMLVLAEYAKRSKPKKKSKGKKR
jgi:hypothetical protein